MGEVWIGYINYTNKHNHLNSIIGGGNLKLAFSPHKGQSTSHSAFYLEYKPGYLLRFCSLTGSELQFLCFLLTESYKTLLSFWASDNIVSVGSCFKGKKRLQMLVSTVSSNLSQIWAFNSSLVLETPNKCFLGNQFIQLC